MNPVVNFKAEVLAGIVDLAHKVTGVPFLNQFGRQFRIYCNRNPFLAGNRQATARFGLDEEFITR